MSASLLGAAMKAKLGSRTRKLVLIKLVDCCHEDGTHIYPALATVAEDAECSVATARRTLKEFVAVGLLRKVRDGGNGRRSTAHYEMDVELLFRLRRPEFWPALEAAALHQPLPGPDADLDDDGGDDEAPRHARDASEGADGAPSCGIKGDTVIPYHGDTLSNDALRVSSDDTQPLSRTLSYEREGVRAHEPAPASGREPAVAVSRLSEGSAAEARPAEEAPAAPAPTFEDLIEAYPHAKVDNRSRLRSLWEALPFEQRRLAVQTIPAFLADRKVAGYKGRMPATEYLAGQNWIGLEAQAAKRAQAVTRGQPLTIDGYTTSWWLLLFDRAFCGKSLGFWMGQAEAKKPLTATGADLAEATTRVGSLQPYRCDGPEIEAWRPWLAAKGARIPPFRGDFRVFLPGPTPPGGKAEAGDDEVRF